MAYFESTQAVTLTAGEDLSNVSIGTFVRLVADGDKAYVMKITNAGTQPAIGTVGQSGVVKGDAISIVMLYGIYNVLCGAAVTAGQHIVLDNSGHAAVSKAHADLAALYSYGIALENGVNKQIIAVMAHPGVFKK